MGLPFQKQAEIQSEPLTDKLKSITNSDTPYLALVSDIRVGCDSTDGVITVNMPTPEEGAGLTIEVYVDTFVSNVTVAGEGFGDITLDAVDEFTTLWSSGKDWHEVGSNHA